MAQSSEVTTALRIQEVGHVLEVAHPAAQHVRERRAAAEER
jgi:hypothetical protein